MGVSIRAPMRCNCRSSPPLSGNVPKSVKLPAVGRNSPISILISVVLPEPLGPSSPKIRPRGTFSDSPSTASTRPYLLVSPSVCITESSIISLLFGIRCCRVQCLAKMRGTLPTPRITQRIPIAVRISALEKFAINPLPDERSKSRTAARTLRVLCPPLGLEQVQLE